jgi:hypothetical protein
MISKGVGALEVAEKLNTEGDGGFNPRIKSIESMAALQAAEKLCFVSGHDFSRAKKWTRKNPALAAEEQYSQFVPEFAFFPQPI